VTGKEAGVLWGNAGRALSPPITIIAAAAATASVTGVDEVDANPAIAPPAERG